MSLPWSSKGLKGTPVNADELLIIDSADANPSTQNKRITIGTLPSATLPVPDTTAIVEGSLDATKLLRFEVDGFTTATTRILTPPNADGTIVLEDFAQTLTNKTITAVANTLIIASTDLTDTADIAYLNTPNSYIAGSKQSFVASASTAALNINAQIPSSLAAGDIFRSAEIMRFRGTSATDYILVSDGQPTTYTAGARQDFLGDTAGDAGLCWRHCRKSYNTSRW